MTIGEVFEQELREQAEAVRRQLERGREEAELAAEAIRRCNPSALVMAARGSSDNAARYAQYLFGAHNRVVVGLATPSLFTLYRRPPSLTGCAVIGISQSGRSPDIVGVLSEARSQGVLAIAVTNDPSSPLAGSADHVVTLRAGPERAVAATKTYTCELTAMAMISAALHPSPSRWSELSQLPESIAKAIELGAEDARQAERYRFARHFVVIGRGFNYGSAMEVALKLKETSYVIAEAYSSADFRHGPSAMLDHALPVVLIAPTGEVHDDVAAIAELCRERGADVIAITDRADLLRRATTAFRLPEGVAEWLSPIVCVVAGQWFALALSHVMGWDPDRPRGLTKVTETR